ncbi:MAG: hypothetical protein QM744_18155 [Mesorhizobium sp.]
MKRRAAVAFILALLSSSSLAQEEGERLFNGIDGIQGRVAIGGTPAIQPLAKFACRSCHQRDGSGGPEANAPSITWDVLSQPTALRPAYDAKSFRLALAEGRRADGSELDLAMPRYTLPDESLASLIDYLTELPAFQRHGIDAREVIFGIPIPPDNREPALRFLALLHDQKIPATFGRNVRFVALEGSREAIIKQARDDVASVVGLVPSNVLSTNDFARADVPVLFPLALLEGDEDTTIIRGMIASRGEQLAQLVSRTADDGYSKPGIACFSEKPCLENVAAVSQDELLDGFDALIITGDDEEKALQLLARLDPLTPIYAIAGELPGLAAAARERRLSLTLVDGYLDLPSTGLLESHARKTAALLAQALTWPGRSLTRSRLIAAFDRRGLPDYGLDYARYPLTGTASARFLHGSAKW